MFEFTNEEEQEKFSKYFSAIPKDLLEKEDKYFEFSKSAKMSKKSKIFPIYQMVDALALPAKDLQVCKKGCANCCQKPVSITLQEAEFIAYKVPGLSVVKENFSFFPQQEVTGPCPFLNTDTQECSIYAYRPYHCRRKLEFTSAENCLKDKKAIDIFWTGLELTLMETSKYQVCDIRHAFSIRKPKTTNP